MIKYNYYLLAILTSTLFFSCNMHEGGVRVSNDMEKYAFEYINDNHLLNDDEKLMAYYDNTIACDGTDAIILTDLRLIHHNKQTKNTSINLEEITKIHHRYESLIGDVIEVYISDGSIFKIEIAPLNNGETFLKVLNSARDIINKKATF